MNWNGVKTFRTQDLLNVERRADKHTDESLRRLQMKNILVIEDNSKHLQDAKDFFSSIKGVKVVFAEDHDSAVKTDTYDNIDLTQYHGVISDIFFPLRKDDDTYGQEEPIGVSIMIRCFLKNVPCVLNTAGYHHGSRYQWICELQRYMRLPEIVDSGGDYFKDSESKDWERAFSELQKLW